MISTMSNEEIQEAQENFITRLYNSHKIKGIKILQHVEFPDVDNITLNLDIDISDAKKKQVKTRHYTRVKSNSNNIF